MRLLYFSYAFLFHTLLRVAFGEHDGKAMNRASLHHEQKIETFSLKGSIYLKLIYQTSYSWILRNDRTNIPRTVSAIHIEMVNLTFQNGVAF